MCLFYGGQRTFQPVDYFGLGRNRFFTVLFEARGHLGACYAQQIEIRQRNVHVHFAGGTDSGRGAPCEFLRWRRLGQCNQLLRNMPPLSIVSLPDPLRWRLGEQHRRVQQNPQQECLH